MQFRLLLLFLLTSLVAASPLIGRAPKPPKDNKPPKTTAVKPPTSDPPKSTPKPAEPTSSSSKSAAISVTSSSSKASSSVVSSKATSSSVSSPVSSSSVSSKVPSSSASSSGTTNAPSGSATGSVTGSVTKSSSASLSSVTSLSSSSRNSTSITATSKASSSVSSSSSSASASASKYICGVGCAKNGCALNPSGTAKPTVSKPKPTKRAESLERRTLKDVSAAEADKYVLDTIKKAGTTNGLDYAFNNDFAVSKHAAFANKPFPMFVTGLEGCTGIAVVSEKGYWISHFMEVAYQPEEKAKYENLVKAVKNGNSKYTRPESLSDLFGEGTNPEIYLMRPRDAFTNELLYETQTKDLMAEIQQGILKGAKVNKLEYKKPKDVKELDTVFETTARGKMLIEYDNNQQVDGKTASPQAAVARVFMEKQIFKQQWAAKENQLEGAADPDKPVEAPVHKPTCLTDDAGVLSEADITAAFDSVFTKGLDISNPISETGTSGDVRVQFNIKFSASQTGCKVATGKKIMRMKARQMILGVAKQCPKSGSTTEFMGVKPDVHSTDLGCLDIDIFKA